MNSSSREMKFTVPCILMWLQLSRRRKKAVKEQKIPFEITADPFYSSANIERLEKAIKELNQGKGKQHEIIEEEADE